MSQIVLSKACGCHASASGPRVVEIPTTHSGTPGGATFSFSLVPMACDRCNLPWLTRLP